MNENRTPNYGLDAPLAVRNMLIVAALGIISLITRLLGVWSRQDLIAVIARPLISAGLGCGAMALWMIYDSKIGKVRERETYLDKINWDGNERVLDVGCGLGLFLIGAAKRLSTGRAVGIDKWQQEDLSGNNAAGTLRNAMIEGVADKVEVHTGDARKLPFDDASFNVVLSSMALSSVPAAWLPLRSSACHLSMPTARPVESRLAAPIRNNPRPHPTSSTRSSPRQGILSRYCSRSRTLPILLS